MKVTVVINIVLFSFAFSLSSCTTTEESKKEEIKENPFAYFDSIQSKISLLIDDLENKHIIPDSSVIENYQNSSAVFGAVEMKVNYREKEGLLTSIHYDFFYDSLNNNLERNIDSLKNFLISRLGNYTHEYISESMTTYSWNMGNSLLDLEQFNNGYSITARKNKAEAKIQLQENKVLPEHLVKSYALLEGIQTHKIDLNVSDTTVISSLFDVLFSKNKKQLFFSETYHKEILLSGTFELKNDKLSAIYFDYLYSEPKEEVILKDAAELKDLIKEMFGIPEEVATTKMANVYTWNRNFSLKLEVYSDGYSIVWEIPNAV